MLQTIDRRLLERVCATDRDAESRRFNLGFTATDALILKTCSPFIREAASDVADAMVAMIMSHARARTIVRSISMLHRMRASLKDYVVTLFGGRYDLEYINDRLGIGIAHQNAGLSGATWQSVMTFLRTILRRCILDHISDETEATEALTALDRVLRFDTTLIMEVQAGGLCSPDESEGQSGAPEGQGPGDDSDLRTFSRKAIPFRDSLTRVYTRRGFVNFLSLEVSIAKRNRSPLSLMYVDVDHLSTVNALQGRDRGDEALQTVASALLRVCRESDVVCRCGGDEFCAILPDCSAADALRITDRFVEELRMSHDPVKVNIDLSQSGPADHRDTERLIRTVSLDLSGRAPADREVGTPSDELSLSL